MSTDDAALKRMAKRAYERGRMRRALGAAMLTLPMIAVSVLVRGTSWLTAISGGLLFVSVLVMSYVGRWLGRGVGAGLLAGVPPLVVPLVLRCAGHACAMMGCAGCACSPVCLPACIASGVIAGVVIGFGTFAESRRPVAVVSSAAILAVLAGSLGCVFAGGFGIVGMALGAFGASASAAALVRIHPRTQR